MDIKLHYTEKGSGRPLILLHGNGEDGSYFVHQTEYFSKSYRAIAVDTRGHGGSPRGAAPFTLPQFADDLYSFMNEMSIQKADLLGFSDGGNIALYFAAKYPGKVNHLIVNGANLHPGGIRPMVQLPVILSYLAASLFARWDPKARKRAEILGLMVNEPCIGPDMLSKITAKTLVIAGTNDMIRRNHTEYICKKIKGARLALIPGDHFIAYQRPTQFNRTVGRFLAGK